MGAQLIFERKVTFVGGEQGQNPTSNPVVQRTTSCDNSVIAAISAAVPVSAVPDRSVRY